MFIIDDFYDSPDMEVVHKYHTSYIIPAKALHNHDIVSVHFNHFYCMEICDKLSRDLAMLTYIYLKVDEC